MIDDGLRICLSEIAPVNICGFASIMCQVAGVQDETRGRLGLGGHSESVDNQKHSYS